MLPRVLTCKHPCSSSNSDSDEIIPKEQFLEPVLLNVYDMYKFNEYAGTLGVGIFHSGVEVYGREFAYGGHHHSYSGIFEMEPRNEEVLGEFFGLRGRLKYKQTIPIGFTGFCYEEVVDILDRLGKKFQGNRYHLITNNCNHFSATFTKILCRKTIPKWVNRLANVGSYIPFLEKIVPREWLTPTCCPHQHTI